MVPYLHDKHEERTFKMYSSFLSYVLRFRQTESLAFKGISTQKWSCVILTLHALNSLREAVENARGT